MLSKKLNCWEYMNCGRECDGKNSTELGICRAAADDAFQGLNGGINGGRIPGLTGVWLDTENKAKARKICAIGVKTSRWVTMHGFALNVNTDLNYFNYIVPCGIDDKAVTSISRELNGDVEISLVEEKLKRNMEMVFEMQLVDI